MHPCIVCVRWWFASQVDALTAAVEKLQALGAPAPLLQALMCAPESAEVGVNHQLVSISPLVGSLVCVESDLKSYPLRRVCAPCATGLHVSGTSILGIV